MYVINIPSGCSKLSKTLFHYSLHSTVSSRARKISPSLLWSSAICNRPFEKPLHFQRECMLLRGSKEFLTERFHFKTAHKVGIAINTKPAHETPTMIGSLVACCGSLDPFSVEVQWTA